MTTLTDFLEQNQTASPLLVFLPGFDECGGDKDQELTKHGPWVNAQSKGNGLYKGLYSERTRKEIKKYHVLGCHLKSKDKNWTNDALSEVNDKINAICNEKKSATYMLQD
jgi:hypothetical protein